MLIHSASQLLTLTGGPQRGNQLGRLGIIPDGAVLIHNEKIMAVGPTEALRNAYPDEPVLDAGGKVVMPGFVDPHTHAIWAGDRASEFELRLQGRFRLEDIESGGGILPTVRTTRSASFDTLLGETRPRLWTMFNYGTTTAEVKTGYGLRTAAELRLLQALIVLNAEGPLELAITFLGAHAVPHSFASRPADYVDQVCKVMLPVLEEWWPHHAPFLELPFVDVNCERLAFSLEQSRRILTQARDMGFPLKIHADQFEHTGSAEMAVELGAVSADHLRMTPLDEIKRLASSDTVAVLLPGIPFGWGGAEQGPAREILAAGGIIALATGLNPGSAWCESLQFVIALACRFLCLTPAEAIAAATINAAAAIRRADQIGSIEPGKQADLLILTTADYRHLGYRFGANLVQTVIKKGHIYPV